MGHPAFVAGQELAIRRSLRVQIPQRRLCYPTQAKSGLNGAPTLRCRSSKLVISRLLRVQILQRRLGAPFKPGFGLSGITALDAPFFVIGLRSLREAYN
jgi:hypothetical protein